MSLNEVNVKSISEADSTTTCTANTPPETVTSGIIDDHDLNDGIKLSSSSVPWPGSTYIIRSISSGHLITLLGGNIVLAKPGGRGSIHWDCVEKDGWLGFRNPVSGKFLGHDEPGKLRCVADHHRDFEYFCIRMKPEGGYVLLMRNGRKADQLWKVGIKSADGTNKDEHTLAKMERSEGILWDFIKV